ncbi:TIGR02588 family protein [Pleurocapsales cyanobacterium LEGE 10410]|nr:TIGR02588 family protein [Pleurocapsales cyanobacterium LEGE 10410]
MPKNSWRRSLAEKVSFSISLSIVGIIVTLICYSWISGNSNPPILSISQFNVRQVNSQYYVPFTVINNGGETAASVEIVAKLTLSPQIVETGRQQLDFLSRKEERSGEFIFSHDPNQGELAIRVASYRLP